VIARCRQSTTVAVTSTTKQTHNHAGRFRVVSSINIASIQPTEATETAMAFTTLLQGALQKGKSHAQYHAGEGA